MNYDYEYLIKVCKLLDMEIPYDYVEELAHQKRLNDSLNKKLSKEHEAYYELSIENEEFQDQLSLLEKRFFKLQLSTSQLLEDIFKALAKASSVGNAEERIGCIVKDWRKSGSSYLIDCTKHYL